MREAMSALLIAATLAASPLAAQAPQGDEAARLAAATVIVSRIFPPGTYSKAMSSGEQYITTVAQVAFWDRPVRQASLATGMSVRDLKKLDDAKLAQVIAIFDPHHAERARIFQTLMTPVLEQIMTDIEPIVQQGLTRTYAKAFTLQQLEDIRRFFATPSGSAYADLALTIHMSPEFTQSSGVAELTQMRRFDEAMPEIMKKSTAASAHLPEPRKAQDLSAADRAKLSEILGVPANGPERPKD